MEPVKRKNHPCFEEGYVEIVSVNNPIPVLVK